MEGNEKIAVEMKALNPSVQSFADVVNKLVSKADRDWEVQIDSGSNTMRSRFIASDQDVKLILRAQDIVSSTSGTLRVRVCVAGEAVDADITGALVEEDE